ncbi:MAG TPA: hypothetical protein VN762_07675, partial [Steroidobacteraceae bacterium]|nr:hypothetical protein [Steroidobacteraceae bacterium]
MKLRYSLSFVLFVLCAAAQAQDAKSVIANATKAMGLEGVNSLYYYGSAKNFSLGQNNNANQPWPQTPLNDYVRAIDFTVPASRATWATFAIPVTGGAATLQRGQQNILPTSPGGWGNQLEIWTTPWGFLKGAAANNATAQAQTVSGKRVQVVTWNAPVKSPGGQNYRVVGYINGDGLVDKVT